jgi:hypothetical protein
MCPFFGASLGFFYLAAPRLSVVAKCRIGSQKVLIRARRSEASRAGTDEPLSDTRRGTKPDGHLPGAIDYNPKSLFLFNFLRAVRSALW